MVPVTAPNTLPSLLSPRSEAVVTATAGVVAMNAEEITARFYPRMFGEHPELLRLFNHGNQATGEQGRALASSVVAYAVQLIDPDAPSFDHVMKRIAHKHLIAEEARLYQQAGVDPATDHDQSGERHQRCARRPGLVVPARPSGDR